LGFADDGFGAGVATVEVSSDGNTWALATGTQSWSADVNVPATRAPNATWQLYLRATDYHSQTSATKILTFSIDSTAPLITPTVPALVGGSGFAIIQGTTQDPAPDSAEVQYVTAQLDSSTAGWANASVSDPGSGGEQNWQYGWSLPYEDGVTHTLRFRATDYAGNAITSTWESVVVDSVPPALTVTQHQAYVVEGGSSPALRGNVTDGAPSVGGVAVISVTLLVYPESGAATQEGATLVDDAWWYVLNMPLGAYTLFVQAQDSAGNTRLIGPYRVQVIEALPYTLTVIVSPTVGGAVTLDPPGVTYTEPLVYNESTVVTLTAVPAGGYVFDAWSGDLEGTTGLATITMTQDMTVTASFDESEFYIYLPLVLRNK
jgi:uncharacterized repeat protein (TIGR02543 family)